jgi:hypothetical protein
VEVVRVAIVCSLVVALTGCARNDDGSTDASSSQALLPSMPETQTVYADGFMTMVSDRPLEAGPASRIAGEIKQAYDFDTTMQQWSGSRLSAPISVAVVSTALMKRVTGQAGGGICWDADSFFTDMKIASPLPVDRAFEANTAAHELEHMQMERLNAYEPAVPIYAFEGIACVLGDRYVKASGVAGGTALLAGEAHGLATMTDADAEDLFANFATRYGPPNKIYWRELLGALFVEFVSTRYVQPPADALVAWGRLTLAVGTGASFDAAFADVYGVALTESQRAFVAFMRDTTNDANARFRRTVWDVAPPP